MTTFHEEMEGKYTFDKSDKACDPYYAFLAHLHKAAKVPTRLVSHACRVVSCGGVSCRSRR